VNPADPNATAVENGGAAQQTAPQIDEPPSRLVQLFLDRGVEIVCALVFLVLLLKTLRGPKAKAGTASGNSATGAPDDAGGADVLVPANRLGGRAARAKVAELVKQDPERVGRILSDWARPAREKTGAKP